MSENDFSRALASISELDEGDVKLRIVKEREDGDGLNTVMSNSFGFGGTNATLVFKRAD